MFDRLGLRRGDIADLKEELQASFTKDASLDRIRRLLENWVTKAEQTNLRRTPSNNDSVFVYLCCTNNTIFILVTLVWLLLY